MNKKPYLSNAVLWATAIIVSAIVKAPVFFTILLLPSLAAIALIVTWSTCRPADSST